MPKFRKKPIVIEAVQYDGENRDEILVKLGMPEVGEDFLTGNLIISTLEGEMTASKGDWIIKGINGEFYPVKNDIFKKTYDPI